MTLLVIKKVLLSYKVAFLFAVLLVFLGFFSYYKASYSVSVEGVEEKYKDTFDSLLSNLEGRWTKDKESKYNKLIDKYDQLNEEYSELTKDLIYKKISEEKFYKFLDDHIEMNKENNACYDELISKVNYVAEKPNERYLMKTDGWWFYFEDNMIYYLILVFLIIMCVLVFVGEVKSGMISIHKFSKWGENRIFLHQWFLVLLMGEVFTILAHVIKLSVYYIRYGLSGFGYPIQSIELFSKCQWNISIVQWLGISIGVQMISTAFFCAVIVAVANMLRNHVETLFTVFLMIVLPKMCLDEKILCSVPNLYTLLFPTDLLLGYDNHCIFVTMHSLFLYMIVAVFLCCLCVWFAKRKGDCFEL